jgi:hypothetical protein
MCAETGDLGSDPTAVDTLRGKSAGPAVIAVTWIRTIKRIPAVRRVERNALCAVRLGGIR